MDLLSNNSTIIETGDILLFSGIKYSSIAIQLGTLSKYNHTAIALWMKTTEQYNLINEDNGDVIFDNVVNNSIGSELYVLESSEGGSYDILTQTRKFGCRVIRLRDVLTDYDEVAVRKINHDRDERLTSVIVSMINDYKNKNYDTSPMSIAMAPMSITITDNSNETFCSELVAEYLYRLGLIPDIMRAEHPPKHFIPKDFHTNTGKIGDNVFTTDARIIYTYDYDFLLKYGIYIIIILLLLFAVIVRFKIRRNR